MDPLNRLEAAACANHPALRAVDRCVRCRTPYCNDCIAYAINDDPWCEACGSAIEEDSKPRYVRGALVLAVGGGFVSALWLAKLFFLPARIPYFFFVLVMGYAGSLYAAWNAVAPANGVDPPTIVRRRPGEPLPKHLRF